MENNPNRTSLKDLFIFKIEFKGNRFMVNIKRQIIMICLWGFGLSIYIFYIYSMITTHNAPIDFLTFLRIGNLLNTHREVYITNSYYPMPYVWFFGVLASIPREISIILWFGLPVLLALYITKWKPWVLFYGPLLSHFFGGQSAVFGMMGLWGFRKYETQNSLTAGVMLGLASFKPQLLLVPLIYAIYTWVLFIIENRSLPKQLIGFILTVSIIYFPTFIYDPTWVTRWLFSPRPFFTRAVSALVPRVLMQLINQSISQFILILAVVIPITSIIALFFLRNKYRRLSNIKTFVLFNYLFFPFIHDYDLIQLIPLVDDQREIFSMILVSIPCYLVILFSYDVDAVWITFSFFTPVLLIMSLFKKGENGKQQVTDLK